MQKPPKQIIDLTGDQVAALRQFYNYCEEEKGRGKPGVLLAQVGNVRHSAMAVNFIPHEIANELMAIMKRMGYYETAPESEEVAR